MTSSLLRPFGIDIFCTGKKFLVYNLVGRNLKIKYRRSVFGVLWTLLSPLSLVVIYYFVFKVVMKVQAPNYIAYLVSGLLPWAFFSQTVMEGLDSVSGDSGLISKIPVPIQIFPLVGTITNIITLTLAIPIMIGVSLGSQITLGPSLILLPLLLGFLALICYSVSIFFGVASVFFHDLKHITGLFMQMWFYGTPVLYRSDMIPEQFRWIIYANPLGSIFVSIHQILAEGTFPSPVHVAVGAAWASVSIFFALIFFNKFRLEVAEFMITLEKVSKRFRFRTERTNSSRPYW